MNSLILLTSIIIIICSALLIVLNLISKKSSQDREKNSPFECGFDPKSSSRLPFSLHFFLIAVIFLIFDVEITLLFPLILTFKTSNILTYLPVMFSFILILLIGLYHEWNQGALNWSY
uniref:NADH-ubiquinone oxidoreductase chain 3 n=1 Tax=Tenebrionoidea sp. 1 KM-2017 TaxID=2219464 RepID=A0A346RJD9_9CUCU|nr:NADH dehydrogenase subunit 3 [Tenebrionoidea sp. 1 KM-2017]